MKVKLSIFNWANKVGRWTLPPKLQVSTLLVSWQTWWTRQAEDVHRMRSTLKDTYTFSCEGTVKGEMFSHGMAKDLERENFIASVVQTLT